MLTDFNIAAYYDENMNEIDTHDLVTLKLSKPQTNFTNNWTAGADGIPPVYVGSDIQQNTITASIELIAYDYLDYSLLKSYLYSIFGFGKPFYVVDKREPGKRNKVILESSFEPERHNPMNGTAVIPFVTIETHYTESIGTTLDLQEKGLNSESGLWGFGMGLLEDPASHQYMHEGTSFRIYNPGHVPIHPFKLGLKITISNVQGSTASFKLRNNTNGAVFAVKEAVDNSDVIILDDEEITSNGLQYLRKTNKEYIQIEPGWNDFTVEGATSAKVEFLFRFYYL